MSNKAELKAAAKAAHERRRADEAWTDAKRLSVLEDRRPPTNQMVFEAAGGGRRIVRKRISNSSTE